MVGTVDWLNGRIEAEKAAMERATHGR